jgi:hypothetical protein
VKGGWGYTRPPSPPPPSHPRRVLSQQLEREGIATLLPCHFLLLLDFHLSKLLSSRTFGINQLQNRENSRFCKPWMLYALIIWQPGQGFLFGMALAEALCSYIPRGNEQKT